MFLIVLCPCANSAATAAVIAASGMWFKSASMAFSFPRAGGRDSIQSSPIEIFAPIFSSTSVKRTSPWMLERPTPSTRTGPPPIAPADRAGVQGKRRKAFLAEIVDARTEGSQGVDQIADRAFVHAR